MHKPRRVPSISSVLPVVRKLAAQGVKLTSAGPIHKAARKGSGLSAAMEIPVPPIRSPLSKGCTKSPRLLMAWRRGPAKRATKSVTRAAKPSPVPLS